MSQPMINHSPDLLRLQEEGFRLQIINNQFLVVDHCPYVNSQQEVKYGQLICVLTLAGPNRTGVPPDHTIYFAGETPCHADGKPMTGIINNSAKQRLAGELHADHYFSSKPIRGHYKDYYEKVRTYAEILGAQARVINKNASEKPDRKNAA